MGEFEDRLGAFEAEAMVVQARAREQFKRRILALGTTVALAIWAVIHFG